MSDTEWLTALDDSSRRVAELVAPLPADRLATGSYATEWSIGDVLSHLGSAAEISTVLVQRGIAGDHHAPTAQDSTPVWDRWNAMSAVEQRKAWFAADARHRELLSTADPAAVEIPYFAGLLDLSTYAGYRLSEQSVHAWDIEVALDPAARIPAAEVDLLWRRLDLVATRFRAAAALQRLAPGQIAIEFTDRDRGACFDLTTELRVVPCEPADPTATLRGPAEALLRLVYGRNRPDDAVEVAGAVTLDDLRALFPGY